MQVTSITEYDCVPGTLIEWSVASSGKPQPSAVPPSFNQRFHLGDLSGAASVWIAGSFDVPGHVDAAAVEWAFAQLISRHRTLSSSFVMGVGGVERVVHSPSAIGVHEVSRTVLCDADSVVEHLRLRFQTDCDPRRFPSYAVAAVDRPDRSTIVCAFDHANVDALSITVVVDEMHTLYHRFVADPLSPLADLAPVGSFVDYCAIEAKESGAGLDDPRIRSWAEFLADCGGTTPRFPIDLGVPLGRTAPQATTVDDILGPDLTAMFEQMCVGAGAGMFSGIVASVASTCAAIGGTTELPFLFPLHTRHEPRWTRALGWFTTNAPMRVRVGASFGCTLASSHRAFRASLPLSTVAIPHVLAAVGDDFSLSRKDIFMISYVDYRKMPVTDDPEFADPHHISNVTVADDAQFWISRSSAGLSLRSRFPDTPVARTVMKNFACELTRQLHALAHGAGVAADVA